MSVKYRDYYEILGIKRDASQDDIQRAYRKLARKYHPDINKEKSAESHFKELSEAYEVLKDPETRKRYDELGTSWRSGQDFRPPPGWSPPSEGFGRSHTHGRADAADFSGFSDFFEAIFGGAPFGQAAPRTQRQPRPRQGHTHEAEIAISLEDAFHGATYPISFNIEQTDDDGHTTRSTRRYDIKIPPGTTDNSVIRLAGQGAPGPHGGPAGDLLLRVRLRPHHTFRTDGHDLVTTLPVSPWEAALGAKIPVPTIDGSALVTIPPGSQSGQRLRLRGKGLPRRSGGTDSHGDLIAELRIAVPKALSQDERALFEKLRDSSTYNPREPEKAHRTP